MKLNPQPTQYVDPQGIYPQYVQPNVIQPNVIQQPAFQPVVDTTPTFGQVPGQQSIYHQYQQSPQFSSPVLATGSYASAGRVDRHGNLVFSSFPWFNIIFGLIFGTIPLIMMIVLVSTLKLYFLFWMLIFPVIGFIVFISGKYHRVKLDKYQRKMYTSTACLVCCCCTRRDEIDFASIRDIQCHINYNKRINRVPTGKETNVETN